VLIYLGKITFCIAPFPGHTYEIITGGGLTLVLRRPYNVGSAVGMDLSLLNKYMFSLLKPTSYITCDVKCWHIQNCSSSGTHYCRHFYFIHPWVIWYSWILHRESDLIRWKSGIVCTWYLIWLRKNIVANYYLFQPANLS